MHHYNLLLTLVMFLSIPASVAGLTYSVATKEVQFYDIPEGTLKRYIAIARTVLLLSGSTMVFLLTQHELLSPHHKITVFGPECLLLGICAGLCILFEISWTEAYDAHNREKEFMQYYDFRRFEKWSARNKTMAITALFCLGFAYFGIIVTVFA